jgi:AAHS family 4-hydroxybenzoate transporter-like MFS transporter
VATHSRERQIIDVPALIEGQSIGPFLIGIVALGFIAQFGDGYDLAATAYAAPGIVHAWHIDRSSLAPVLSANLFGMLFGAPIFGYVGDRFGRRIAILICCVVLGVFTLASAEANSLLGLGLLRFATGLGLGGLPANTIALMAEYAPKRSRATLITVMFMGITVGGMVPGFVAAMAPGASWRMLFVIGGVMPLLAGILNFFFLPESLKFLALRKADNAKILKVVRRMRAQAATSDDAQFHFPLHSTGAFSIRMLFEGKLGWITPLLWVVFSANVMTNFFLNSWMPTLLHQTGLSASQAALTASMYYVGGVIGGLTISRFLDRTGIGAVSIVMLLSGPVVTMLGFVAFSENLLKFAVLAVGMTVLGNQLALNAVMGLAYPTAFRANGVGWALGVGRICAIAGPLVGGALIAMHLKLRYLFMFPTVPLAIGFIASLMLWRLWRYIPKSDDAEDELAAAPGGVTALTRAGP